MMRNSVIYSISLPLDQKKKLYEQAGKRGKDFDAHLEDCLNLGVHIMGFVIKDNSHVFVEDEDGRKEIVI